MYGSPKIMGHLCTRKLGVPLKNDLTWMQESSEIKILNKKILSPVAVAILSARWKLVPTKTCHLCLLDGKKFHLKKGMAERSEYLWRTSGKELFLVLFYISVAENAFSARQK